MVKSSFDTIERRTGDGDMDKSGQHPCNICGFVDCDECIMHRYNENYVCEAYECFCNYDGGCLLNMYDDCRCREYFRGRNHNQDWGELNG